MEYKTLQHKTRPGMFGIVIPEGDGVTLGVSSIPQLQPETATLQAMKKEFWKTPEYYKGVLQELENYELIPVTLLTILN